MLEKAPLVFNTGAQIKALRVSLNLTQVEFWCRIGINQSSGSRYESGHSHIIPPSVLLLIQIVFGSSDQSKSMLKYLRAVH